MRSGPPLAPRSAPALGVLGSATRRRPLRGQCLQGYLPQSACGSLGLQHLQGLPQRLLAGICSEIVPRLPPRVLHGERWPEWSASRFEERLQRELLVAPVHADRCSGGSGLSGRARSPVHAAVVVLWGLAVRCAAALLALRFRQAAEGESGPRFAAPVGGLYLPANAAHSRFQWAQAAPGQQRAGVAQRGRPALEPRWRALLAPIAGARSAGSQRVAAEPHASGVGPRRAHLAGAALLQSIAR